MSDKGKKRERTPEEEEDFAREEEQRRKLLRVSRTHTQTSGEDEDKFREQIATLGEDDNPLSASLFGLREQAPPSLHQTLGGCV